MTARKNLFYALTTGALCLYLLTGCSPARQVDRSGSEEASSPSVILTDWSGHQEGFAACPERVVAASGSLGEVWLNAGGNLIGITEDAVSERNLPLPEDVTIVGSIKEPDLETILSLDPDFLILSADIAGHQALVPTLEKLSIPYGLFHEEYFEDYLSLLQQFSTLTGQPGIYQKNGLRVQQEIEAILAETSAQEGKTFLLLRAYGSGFKAKNGENLTGVMLKDLGLENVLDRYDSLLEDISMEEILAVDPDYIFVTIMGSDPEKAVAFLEGQLCSDPAWATLTAIQSDNYHILPKDLFHYKPNARWAEAYAYLADILSA